MRRKTSKILLLAVLSGLAPLTGFAHATRTSKAAGKPAASHPHGPAASAAKKSGKAAGEPVASRSAARAGKARAQLVSARTTAAKGKPGKAGRLAAGREEPGRKVSGREVSGRQVADGRTPGNGKLARTAAHVGRDGSSGSLKTAAREPVRVPAAELAEKAPEPLPESHSLPEIHVTHNRKQHLKPDEPVPAPDDAPAGTTPMAEAVPVRKARPRDFLTPASAQPLTGISRPDAEPISTSEGNENVPAAPTIGAALRLAAPAQTQRGPAPVVRTAGGLAGGAAGKTAGKGSALPAAAPPAPVMAVLRKPAPVMPVVEAREQELLPPPVPMPALYTKAGRLIMPAALKGSHDILIHQNVMADHDGLDRIQDDNDLLRMREAKLLVPLPEDAAMRADERLPANRRYARPWTVAFLNAIAQAHYARFHEALQVTSAVRTVEFQQRLMLTNGNAAPAEGDTASPHLTGQAVDLAKKPLSPTEIAWMRGYLLPLVQEGKIDVEEEFQQACFHISVYRKYLPQAAPKRTIIPHRTTGMALAAALP